MLNLKKSIFLLVSLVAAVVANAASWTGGTEEPTKYEKNQESGISYTLIENAEQLAWIAARVNSGDTELYVKLNADIVVVDGSISTSSRAWTPIGNTEASAFKGIFDGNGHTVSGIYSKESLAGFFGVIGSFGIVKNLKLSNGLIQNTNIAGGVAAISKGVIDNCENGFAVRDAKTSGGIAGSNEGVIGNSKNVADVAGSEYAGGIVGSNKGTLFVNVNEKGVSGGTYTSGVAGYNEGDIKSCINEGAVSGGSYTGGIAGYNTGNLYKSSNKSTVHGKSTQAGAIAAYNSGYIDECFHYGDASSYCEGNTCYAGMIGYNLGEAHRLVNEGKISSSGYNVNGGGASAAGVCGRNAGLITDSYNVGEVESYQTVFGGARSTGVVIANETKNGKILNVYSASKIIAKFDKNWSRNTWAAASSVVMSNAELSTLENVFTNTTLANLGVGTETGILINVNGMTSAEMAKDSLAWVLNTSNGSVENTGIWTRFDENNNGFPIFTSDTTAYKPIYRVTFDDGIGTRVSRYSNYKGIVSFPDNPGSNNENKFVAWVDVNGRVYKEGTLFSKDVALFAKYALEDSDIHVVMFKDSNGMELFTSLTNDSGVLTVLPEDPTPGEGQYFKGWYTQDMELIDNTTVLDGDKIVVAVFGELKDLKFFVVFKNADGDTLQKDSVGYNIIPTFEGIPELASTAEYSYTFTSWTPELVAAKEDAVYTASYSSSINEYEVTFIDYDETMICSVKLPYGTDVEFCGSLPSRESTELGSYSFSKWDKPFTAVVENISYKAVYDSVMNKITVAFSLDGVTLQTKTIAYGAEHVYTGEEPYRDPSAQYEYRFSGWSLDEKSTSTKKYYTAVFDSTLRAYKVTFKVDGEVVQSKSVFYGSKPSYTGDEPSRAKSENYTYEFAGWTPEIKSVTGAQTYTAVFDSTKIAKPASSSSVPNSSSSSGKGGSSSSNKDNSSSSGDKEALTIVKAALQFSVEVQGRILQIAGAKSGAVYSLMDMQGRLLKQGTADANFSIEVPRAGTYLIRINKSISRVAVK